MVWTLANRYVLVAFALQVPGYAALVGFIEHDEVTPLVGFLRGLPGVLDPLLALLGVFAVPAALISVAVVAGAAVVTGGSVPPSTGLVTAGDLPVLLVAYLLAVGAGVAIRRYRSKSGA